MATLIQAYEQQYSVLTADLTSKIGRLKVANEDDHDQLIKEINANFEEANDLLEQLDLECRGFGASAAAARAAAYRAELGRVKREYNSLTAGNEEPDNEEIYDEWSSNEHEQQQKLLTKSHSSKGRRALAEGYRIAMETEEIGAHVLRELGGQRETIQRSRDTLRDTEATLSRSTRVINTMVSRALQQRIAIMAMVFATGVIVCASLYLYLS